MKKLLYWLPFSVYSLVLVRLLLSPSNELPTFLAEQSDKLLHLMAFAGLMFFYLLAITQFFSKPKLNAQSFFVGFLLLSLLGGILEILQQFVPGRNTSISDFWFNNFGLAAGFILFWVLKKLYMLFVKH